MEGKLFFLEKIFSNKLIFFSLRLKKRFAIRQSGITAVQAEAELVTMLTVLMVLTASTKLMTVTTRALSSDRLFSMSTSFVVSSIFLRCKFLRFHINRYVQIFSFNSCLLWPKKISCAQVGLNTREDDDDDDVDDVGA